MLTYSGCDVDADSAGDAGDGASDGGGGCGDDGDGAGDGDGGDVLASVC